MFDSFATTSLPVLNPGLGWNVIYSNFAVLLSVINSPVGDYNRNGTVDAADYVLWRNTLGQMGIGLAADGDTNGQIDNGDYNVWRAHFGEAALGSGATANLAPGESPGANYAVPEPRAIVPLLAGIMLSADCAADFVAAAAPRQQRHHDQRHEIPAESSRCPAG